MAAASDKVYQLLAHGLWFSLGTLASSTTKTGLHDNIAEILLKVALKHQKLINQLRFHGCLIMRSMQKLVFNKFGLNLTRRDLTWLNMHAAFPNLTKSFKWWILGRRHSYQIMLAHFLPDSNQIYDTQVIYGQYLWQFFSNLHFSSRVILRPMNVSVSFMIFCYFLWSFISFYLQYFPR